MSQPRSSAMTSPVKATALATTPPTSKVQRRTSQLRARVGDAMDRILARAPWVRTPWFGSLLVIAGALLTRAPGYIRQLFDSDEAAIATMGMVVSRGGVLYHDVIDRKPPLAPLVYAGSFLLTGGRDLRPLHFVAALGLGVSAVVLAYGARRVADARAGWWSAGLLIAGATAMRPVDAQAANFAHFALLPACGAIVAARAGSRRSAALAGVLVGVATLTRQTWVIGVVPAAYASWWWGGRRPGRAVIVIACALATILSVAVIVPFGDFWHWVFSGNGSVLALGESQAVFERGAPVVELFLLANVATCWLVAQRRWHREDLDLWLWLGTGLVAFVAGFRFFGHYWFQVLPPLCLLAGLGVAACPKPVRRMLVVAAVIPAVIAWLLAFSPRLEARPNTRAVAAYARTHTRPGDRVTVWGAVPEVYWLSGRAPGGAMVTTDFVLGRTAGRADGPQRRSDATPGALKTFLASLHAHPPTLFLDTSTAGTRHYKRYPLTFVPAVAAFVRMNYVRVGTVRGVEIYRLRRRDIRSPLPRPKPLSPGVIPG